jgi:hypothetical protein
MSCCVIFHLLFLSFLGLFGETKATMIRALSDWRDFRAEVIPRRFLDFELLDGRLNARDGQACLAQARQDRPGFGELDLTKLLVIRP